MSKKEQSPTHDKKVSAEKTSSYIAQKLGIEQINFDMLEGGFVEQNSNKNVRKKIVKEQLWGFSDEENVTKRQRFLKGLVSTLFLVFVIAVLVYTAYKDFIAPERDFPSIEELIAILKPSWIYVLLALVALGCNYFFKGLKLSVMCKALTKKFHLKTCMETGIIGNYFNNVTPLATGGQAFEIHHLSRHGVDGGVAYSATIASFLLNQLAFVILGITALSLFTTNYFGLSDAIYGIFPSTIKVLAIIGFACCTLMPLLVVVFSLMPKLGAGLVKVAITFLGKLRLVKSPEKTIEQTIKNITHNAECLRKIGKSPIAFISSFIFSFFEHFATVSLTFFVLKAFGYSAVQTTVRSSLTLSPDLLAWCQSAQITLILLASIAFIPSPGNSGAADLSFFIFFEAGLKAGLAFPATVIWRVLSFYSYIIIGFIFATLKKRADRKKEVAKLKAEQDKLPQQLEMDLSMAEINDE